MPMPHTHRFGRSRLPIVIAVALLAGCAAPIRPADIADVQLAMRVKTALINDPIVGALAIEVRVVRGVASLSGRVRSAADADRAFEIASGVPGVAEVRSNLQVGGDVVNVTEPAARPPDLDGPEIDPAPGLLAVGLAAGWSVPRLEALKTRGAISPLVKLGAPRGFGPAVGFDWFHADLESAGGTDTLTRVHVRPVMVGVGYTLAADRFSLSPSIVAGVAFNSLSLEHTGGVHGLPIEVGNSLAWRVGASVWYDATRRVAINASMGYLMTGFKLTVLTDGRLDERRSSGDTALLRVGVAYRLF